jgi:MYXO-CTERM domain-containing protein
VGANPVMCVASDQCHEAGSCNPETGTCANLPKPDGTSCGEGRYCLAGECLAAPPTAPSQFNVTGTSVFQCSSRGEGPVAGWVALLLLGLLRHLYRKKRATR